MANERPTFDEAIKSMRQAEIKPKYPPFFRFDEEGDWVKGVISDPREIDTEYGKQKVVSLTEKSGEVHSVSLSANLSCLWDMAGKEVLIKYVRQERNTGRKGYTKIFELYIA